MKSSHSLIRFAVLVWILGLALVALLVLCLQSRFKEAAETLRSTAYTSQVKTPQHLPPLPIAPLPFDKDSAYLLSAWSRQGLRHVGDGGDILTLGDAGGGSGNVLEAQLIRRALSPEQVLVGATITWKLLDEPNGELGAQRLKENAQRGENGMERQGVFKLSDDGKFYQTDSIPLLPYTDKGKFMPYPVALVEARDAKGNLIASTQTVLPLSSEFGCKNCHTGGWKNDGKAGIGRKTALDVLTIHDRINNTTLTQDAKSGPVDCSSCHSGTIPEMPALSAAIHGWHANYMSGRGADACYACHPADPMGATRFYRDRHVRAGLTCVSCHGYLEDHAVSLLLNERANATEAAHKLMNNIKTVSMPVTDIKPRKPWVNEPDCTSCHDFVNKPIPSQASGFNKWAGEGMKDKYGDDLPLFSQRYDLPEVTRCSTCHGAPHAIYPAQNPYGQDRDALVPLQYQQTNWVMGSGPAHGPTNCQVCHMDPMEFSAHHEMIVPEAE